MFALVVLGKRTAAGVVKEKLQRELAYRRALFLVFRIRFKEKLSRQLTELLSFTQRLRDLRACWGKGTPASIREEYGRRFIDYAQPRLAILMTHTPMNELAQKVKATLEEARLMSSLSTWTDEKVGQDLAVSPNE